VLADTMVIPPPPHVSSGRPWLTIAIVAAVVLALLVLAFLAWRGTRAS
jgi:hypothetical protein